MSENFRVVRCHIRSRGCTLVLELSETQPGGKNKPTEHTGLVFQEENSVLKRIPTRATEPKQEKHSYTSASLNKHNSGRVTRQIARNLETAARIYGSLTCWRPGARSLGMLHLCAQSRVVSWIFDWLRVQKLALMATLVVRTGNCSGNVCVCVLRRERRKLGQLY